MRRNRIGGETPGEGMQRDPLIDVAIGVDCVELDFVVRAGLQVKDAAAELRFYLPPDNHVRMHAKKRQGITPGIATLFAVADGYDRVQVGVSGDGQLNADGGWSGAIEFRFSDMKHVVHCVSVGSGWVGGRAAGRLGRRDWPRLRRKMRCKGAEIRLPADRSPIRIDD